MSLLMVVFGSPGRRRGEAYAIMDQLTEGLVGALKVITGQKTISENNVDDALK